MAVKLPALALFHSAQTRLLIWRSETIVFMVVAGKPFWLFKCVLFVQPFNVQRTMAEVFNMPSLLVKAVMFVVCVFFALRFSQITLHLHASWSVKRPLKVILKLSHVCLFAHWHRHYIKIICDYYFIERLSGVVWYRISDIEYRITEGKRHWRNVANKSKNKKWKQMENVSIKASMHTNRRNKKLCSQCPILVKFSDFKLSAGWQVYRQSSYLESIYKWDPFVWLCVCVCGVICILCMHTVM